MTANRINIAHLTYSLDTGGIENGIINLVNRMDHDHFYHYIICVTYATEFRKRITSENYEIISLNKKPGNDLKLYFRLWSIFVKKKIDIVHCRGWATMMEGIISARLARVPVIIYGFHGKTYEDIQEEKRRRVIAQKILLKLTDGIITLIDNMKNDLCSSLSIPGEKVEIIKNGVDLTKFGKGDRRLRQGFNVGDDEYVVGVVGRIDPVKNYAAVIEAFHIVSSKYKNIKMIIVGEGPDFKDIEAKIEGMGLSGSILMLGSRDDVYNLLQCFDVFIQPSFYEGLSNTILEAMATGLPVIASRVGGNPDVIKEDENGLLFSPGDVDGLANAIEKMYLNKELRENMASANKAKIVNEFSLEKMVAQYERYYQKLLLKKRGNIA